ncbi:MAG: ATP-binding cassette domain-containing protein [Lachnospiraceae bacterium]|nr:ATP-binding cassette domain-containing protein [Lachnospiraceae bacterium]
MEKVVEVRSVCKSYGSSQVINNCSFEIRSGEIYGLLGVNGAGKTTLMKMILGLQRLDGGSIYVLGKEADGGRKYLSDIGSMIEMPVFYEHLNAEELLSMHLALMEKKADIPEVLALVGLGGAGKKPVSQYSLGMKQRLGIARAIIHRPRLLILDEPLNGLDPIAITEMRELMRKLSAAGISILLSSHIVGEIRHTADRIGILSGGYIRQEFAVEETAAQYGEGFEDYVVCVMAGNDSEGAALKRGGM